MAKKREICGGDKAAGKSVKGVNIRGIICYMRVNVDVVVR